jgi:hypothetical protein
MTSGANSQPVLSWSQFLAANPNVASGQALLNEHQLKSFAQSSQAPGFGSAQAPAPPPATPTANSSQAAPSTPSYWQRVKDRSNERHTWVADYPFAGIEIGIYDLTGLRMPVLVCAAAAPVAPDATGASSPLQAQNLARQLTSEEQLGQAKAGQGEPIFGAGTNQPLLDAQRLSQQYGGNPADWAKMGGESSAVHGVQTPAGNNFETHWYQNMRTGQVVEIKTKITGH